MDLLARRGRRLPGQQDAPSSVASSKGHRPRAAMRPGRVMLFDEPTSALDPEAVNEALDDE